MPERSPSGSSSSDASLPGGQDYSIKVAVRVRPSTQEEKEFLEKDSKRKRMSFSKEINNPNANPILSKQLQLQAEHEARQQHVVCVGKTQVSINSSKLADTRNFVFDWVANPEATQGEVWKNVGQDVAKSTLQGFNGTIIAYGQTGSGKTHTIFGSGVHDVSRAVSQGSSPVSHGSPVRGAGAKDSDERGLVPRALRYIWDYIYSEEQRELTPRKAAAARKMRLGDEDCGVVESKSPSDICSSSRIETKTFDVSVSMCEIYNERVYDLLDEPAGIIDKNATNGIHSSTPLQLRDDPIRGIFVEGLTEEPLHSPKDAEKVLAVGLKNRHTASTLMNRASSRSHAIFLLRLDLTTELEGVRSCRSSKFTLVDLAGSERQKKTSTSDARLREAGQINRSLSELGNVIHSLTSTNGSQHHVQYRNSKLTYLLRDSLGGNSKTVMMATVTQSENSIAETMTTLKFAQRAKKIKNIVKLNEQLVSGTVEALQKEIAALKRRIAESTMIPQLKFNMTDMTSPMVFNSAAKYIASLSPKPKHKAIANGSSDSDSNLHGIAADIASACDGDGAGGYAATDATPMPRALHVQPHMAAATATATATATAAAFEEPLRLAMERCLAVDELRIRAELKSRALSVQLQHTERLLEDKEKISENISSAPIAAITAIIRAEMETDMIKQQQIVQEIERRMSWTQEANSNGLGIAGQWVWADQEEDNFNHTLIASLKEMGRDGSYSNPDSPTISSAANSPSKVVGLESDLKKANDLVTAYSSEVTELKASLEKERTEFERYKQDNTMRCNMNTAALQEQLRVVEAEKTHALNSAGDELQGLLSIKDIEYQRLMQQKREVEVEVYEMQRVVEDLRISFTKAHSELNDERREKDGLSRAMKKLKDQLDERSSLEADLATADEQLRAIQESCDSLIQEKSIVEDTLRQQEAKMHEDDGAATRLISENEWMREEVDSLLVQAEALMGEKQRLKILLDARESELATMIEQKESLEERCSILERDDSSKKEHTKELQAIRQVSKSQESQLQILHEQYSSLHFEHSKLQEELCIANDKEIALKEMTQSLSQQLSITSNSKSDISEEIHGLKVALEATTTQAETMSTKCKSLETDIEHLTCTLKHVESQLVNKSKSCESLRATMRSSDLHGEILKQEHEEITEEMKKMSEEVGSFRDYVRRLEEQRFNQETAKKIQASEFLQWKQANTPQSSPVGSVEDSPSVCTPTNSHRTPAKMYNRVSEGDGVEQLRMKLEQIHQQQLGVQFRQLTTKHANEMAAVNRERTGFEVRKSLIADAAADAAASVKAPASPSAAAAAVTTYTDARPKARVRSQPQHQQKKPPSPFKSSSSIHVGVFDRNKPTFANMRLLQSRNESKLDRLNFGSKCGISKSNNISKNNANTSTASVNSEARTETDVSSGAMTECESGRDNDCSNASTADLLFEQSLDDCSHASTASHWTNASSNIMSDATPMSQQSTEYDGCSEMTSIGSALSDQTSTPLMIRGDLANSCTDMSGITEGSHLLFSPEQEQEHHTSSMVQHVKFSPLAEMAPPPPPPPPRPTVSTFSAMLTPPTAHAKQAASSTRESPAASPATGAVSETDDDNDFEGVESDISVSTVGTPVPAQLTPTHTPTRASPADSVTSAGTSGDEEAVAVLQSEGRIYSRISNNISLGGTNINDQRHLLSQSLMSSAFLSKGEWKESYWAIDDDAATKSKSHKGKVGENSNNKVLEIYRSKSDFKYNPNSATGKIKSIILSTATSKKDVTADNNEDNNENVENSQNGVTSCTSPLSKASSSIHAKHIKSRPFKGRTIYSFVLCESSIQDKKMSPPRRVLGSLSVSPKKNKAGELQEKVLVKFASTDRSQVEALWTSVHANIV